MRIKILSLDHRKVYHSPAGIDYTRFIAQFLALEFRGVAYLYVLGAVTKSTLARAQKVLLARPVLADVVTSVGDIYDFGTIPSGDMEPDVALPLGPLGHFSFRGRIKRHLTSGEGSIFETSDISVTLYVKQLPPDSLELHGGTRVSFRTNQFELWLLDGGIVPSGPR